MCLHITGVSVASSVWSVFTMCLHITGVSVASSVFTMCLHITGVSVASSVFTISMLSLDRYLAIRHPMTFRAFSAGKHAFKIVLAIWILSFRLVHYFLSNILLGILFKVVSFKCANYATVLPEKYM